MSVRLRNRFLAGLAFTAMLGGCASIPPADATTTFVVVRHAEKGEGGSDPSLSAMGQARAQALATRLGDAPVRAAYATGYRRTQETAGPTAMSHHLAVTSYDARLAADAFAAQLRSAHADGTVLVVGHSNTAPGIAAALCGCEVAPMAETEFDRLMTVRVDADGHATLQQERY